MNNFIRQSYFLGGGAASFAVYLLWGWPYCLAWIIANALAWIGWAFGCGYARIGRPSS